MEGIEERKEYFLLLQTFFKQYHITINMECNNVMTINSLKRANNIYHKKEQNTIKSAN